MELDNLKERFFALVAPDLPNDWEVEEALEGLTGAAPDLVETVLAQVPVIWPVSNSLCYNYLGQAVGALSCFPPAELGAWVNETLDRYEKGGLQAAQRFMVNVEEEFVCRLRGIAGLRFDEVQGRLLPYVRGLAGRDLELAAAATACTDGETIYLPREISLARGEADNFLLYKLTASFQWAFLELGSFAPASPLLPAAPDTELAWLPLARFFDSLAHPGLAADIYLQLESIRARAFLARELPGLMREALPLLPACPARPAAGDRAGRLVSELQCYCLSGDIRDASLAAAHGRRLRHLVEPGADAARSLELCRDLHAQWCPDAGDYHSPQPLFFQGTFRLDLVLAARNRRRRSLEQRFVDTLATVLVQTPAPGEGTGGDREQAAGEAPAPDVALVLDSGGKRHRDAEQTAFLRINNEQVVLDEELEALAREVTDEFGFLPPRFISSAAGRAGRAAASGAPGGPAGGGEVQAPVVYDEWDHRRNGFRKNWCIMTEKEVPVTRSTFIAATLARYRGHIVRLRNQF